MSFTYHISANSFRGNYFFWKLGCGKYSREETIVSCCFVSIYNFRFWSFHKKFQSVIKNTLFNAVYMKYIILTYLPTYLHTFLGMLILYYQIENFCGKRKIENMQVLMCNHYSVSAEINQGRKLFKGGNYSRAETIRGNTVSKQASK